MTDEKTVVFDKAAALFALLSRSIHLCIMSELCQGERNVGQLFGSIDVAQPNMSQHLNMIDRTGMLGWRRQSSQIFIG